MPYDQLIKRDNASALIPVQDYGAEILEGAIRQSATLNMFRRLPNMTAKQAKMRVLDALPAAYWVTGDTGLKNTTNLAWANKYIEAEELAVIVPISEAVLEDSAYDIWAEAQPRIIEAFGQKIDQAVFAGIDKPLSFRAPLIDSIIAAGAVVTDTPSDLYGTINDGMSFVEQSGYNVTGLVGGVELKAAFRMMKDTTGQPLQASEITALKRAFIDNGSWDSSVAKMIIGDFRQAVFAIRKDVTFKLLDQSVLSDADGKIIYNFAQQDMVGLRVVMRMGWQIPNPINILQPDAAVRFPFALVVPTEQETANLTFNVTGANSTGIAGARISLGSMIRTTDASGAAVFPVRVSPTMGLTYSITAQGFQRAIGYVETGSEQTIDVELSAGLPAAIPAGGQGGIAPTSVDMGGLEGAELTDESESLAGGTNG